MPKGGSAKKREKKKRKRAEKELQSMKARRKLEDSGEISDSDLDSSQASETQVSVDSVCLVCLDSSCNHPVNIVENDSVPTSSKTQVDNILDVQNTSEMQSPVMQGLNSQVTSTPACVNLPVSAVTHVDHAHENNSVTMPIQSDLSVGQSAGQSSSCMQNHTNNPCVILPVQQQTESCPPYVENILMKLSDIDARLSRVPGENWNDELSKIELSALVTTTNALKSSVDSLTTQIRTLSDENAKLHGTISQLHEKIVVLSTPTLHPLHTAVSSASQETMVLPTIVNQQPQYVHNPPIPQAPDASYIGTNNVEMLSDNHANGAYDRREMFISPDQPEANTDILPPNHPNDSNMCNTTLIIGSSILKHFSAGRLSSANNITKVKTMSGAKIADIRLRLEQMDGLETVQNLVIHAGTCNIGQQDNQILSDFYDLVAYAKQSLPQSHVVLCSILPRPFDANVNNQIFRVNDALRDMCAKNGVTFADNTRLFLDEQTGIPIPMYYEDHIHVSITGTKILARSICDYCDITRYIDPQVWQQRQPRQDANFTRRRLPGRTQQQQGERYQSRRPLHPYQMPPSPPPYWMPPPPHPQPMYVNPHVQHEFMTTSDFPTYQPEHQPHARQLMGPRHQW